MREMLLYFVLHRITVNSGWWQFLWGILIHSHDLFLVALYMLCNYLFALWVRNNIWLFVTIDYNNEDYFLWFSMNLYSSNQSCIVQEAGMILVLQWLEFKCAFLSPLVIQETLVFICVDSNHSKLNILIFFFLISILLTDSLSSG